MNLRNLPSVPLVPATGTWYRSVSPQFLDLALSASHTLLIPTRFSPAGLISAPYEVLYFAENHNVALLEFNALLGSPSLFISNHNSNLAVVCVRVQTNKVVDLTNLQNQRLLGIDAQMLTGNWSCYQTRRVSDSVSVPTGIAPTQALGHAIQADSRSITGIITISAKSPTNRILVLFPKNFGINDSASYTLISRTGKIKHISL